MKKLPTVVIVGRPNVGKSSLFNRIVGRRAAVVSDREGVTRDRHYHEILWDDRRFNLVDTGGYLLDAEVDEMADSVRGQIFQAVEDASVIVFLVDAQTGIADLDIAFAKIIRKVNNPCILVANKGEKADDRYNIYDFLKLGLGEPFPLSALTGFQVGDFLQKVVSHIPPQAKGEYHLEEMDDNKIKFAILGRPNAGKSTLLNQILGETRQIVSPVAGTTRDSIDCEFLFQGKEFVITDTAGLRKKGKVNDEVEYFANMRSIEAIRRSYVSVVMVDVVQGLGLQDMRIIRQVLKHDKGLVILLNKWDALDKDDKTYDQMVRTLKEKLPELERVPIFSISALTGQRVPRIFEAVMQVHENCFRVLGRDQLMELFDRAIYDNAHSMRNNQCIIMTKICQVMVNPIVLSIECNHPEFVDESWKRFFVRRVRESFDLLGAPVKLNFDKTIRLRSDEDLVKFQKGPEEFQYVAEDYDDDEFDDEDDE